MRRVPRILFSLLGLLLVFFCWMILRPELWWLFNYKVPNELEVILRSSDSPKELGKLPRIVLVKEFNDSEWFVIAYRDTHAAGPYSCSVLRCSDGSWFDSKRHYCGQFGAARYNLALLENPPPHFIELPPEDAEELKASIQDGLDSNPIGVLLKSRSLDEAKSAMAAIGFINRK